ncbi:unnamed protein product [Dibothriocephalus latus]|uniref:Uncharacterized protein n=1 Tax=Dibothriocephalus latus TaxID=60516 RepID=A0A3P7LS66_DIBLA|nr:unnamed protein product [Dibothriocephalus latus]
MLAEPSGARGFLLLVTNADWAARRINTQVFNAYASAGYANVADLKARVIESWKAITDSLVDRYVHVRGGWLCAPFRTLPPSRQSEDTHPDPSTMESMVSAAMCNLSHVHSELVLVLGVPVGGSATNNASSRLAQFCASSPTYPEEVALPSYCRMQPILQLICAKLADAVQQRCKVNKWLLSSACHIHSYWTPVPRSPPVFRLVCKEKSECQLSMSEDRYQARKDLLALWIRFLVHP